MTRGNLVLLWFFVAGACAFGAHMLGETTLYVPALICAALGIMVLFGWRDGGGPRAD